MCSEMYSYKPRTLTVDPARRVSKDEGLSQNKPNMARVGALSNAENTYRGRPWCSEFFLNENQYTPETYTRTEKSWYIERGNYFSVKKFQSLSGEKHRE